MSIFALIVLKNDGLVCAPFMCRFNAENGKFLLKIFTTVQAANAVSVSLNCQGRRAHTQSLADTGWRKYIEIKKLTYELYSMKLILPYSRENSILPFQVHFMFLCQTFYLAGCHGCESLLWNIKADVGEGDGDRNLRVSVCRKNRIF